MADSNTTRETRIAAVHAEAEEHARKHESVRHICSFVVATSTIAMFVLLALGVIHL